MPSVYRSVTINTSKETMRFSDFPAPDCFPNYTHSSKLRDYFRMYAKYFGLPKCICLKVKYEHLCPVHTHGLYWASPGRIRGQGHS